MWNGGPYYHDMGGFLGGWHGVFGFHGLLWLVLLAVIAIALFALVRDWRHEHTEDTLVATAKTTKNPEVRR